MIQYNLKVTLVLLFVLGASTLTASAESAAGAESVTQRQFLDRIIETHPFFQSEALATDALKSSRQALLGARDWNVVSSASFIHDEPSFAFSGPDKTDAFSFSAGVAKSLWSTGGRLSAGLTSVHSQLDIDPLFGIPDSFTEHKLELSYTHPLMRNRGGMLDRLQFDLAQFDVDLSEVIALENQEVFLAGLGAKYFDWAVMIERRSIFSERLQLSEEELSNTKRKRDNNLIDEVDVIRAEDAARISRQNLLLIESQLNALQSEISILVQDSAYVSASPAFDLYALREMSDWASIESRIKDNSRILKSLIISMDKLGVLRGGFQETLKPELNLFANLDVKRADSDFASALGLNKPSARIGVQYNFPVGNRTAQSQIAETDYQARKLEKQYQHLLLALRSSVSSVFIQLNELEQVLELNREQIESSKRKTQEELSLYDQGRGELTFVIQSRDSEQGAKLTYAANALRYHKLLLQFDELMDNLLN